MLGSRLGVYEVVAPLGAGGMGEVYRARDTKLGRDVAIKVLAESVVADPERVTRLRREAQILAALNHPHIARWALARTRDTRKAQSREPKAVAACPSTRRSPWRARWPTRCRLRTRRGSKERLNDEAAPQNLVVVQNWAEELRRLVPAP